MMVELIRGSWVHGRRYDEVVRSKDAVLLDRILRWDSLEEDWESSECGSRERSFLCFA